MPFYYSFKQYYFQLILNNKIILQAKFRFYWWMTGLSPESAARGTRQGTGTRTGTGTNQPPQHCNIYNKENISHQTSPRTYKPPQLSYGYNKGHISHHSSGAVTIRDRTATTAIIPLQSEAFQPTQLSNSYN